MFPHKVTLFNVYKIDEKVYYHRTLLDNVFFYKSNQVVDEGKGITNASQYHLIVPLGQLNNYVDRKVFHNSVDKQDIFTFVPNDIIVFGECESVNSIIELQKSSYDYFAIKVINDNRYGSQNLQSIEVTD